MDCGFRCVAMAMELNSKQTQCVSRCVCVWGGGHWGLIYSFHTMAFTSLPLAGVNLVGWSALFALAYVPENTMSLHRSLSQLSDKRLGV